MRRQRGEGERECDWERREEDWSLNRRHHQKKTQKKYEKQRRDHRGGRIQVTPETWDGSWVLLSVGVRHSPGG